jgi:hypothetical protein
LPAPVSRAIALPLRDKTSAVDMAVVSKEGAAGCCLMKHSHPITEFNEWNCAVPQQSFAKSSKIYCLLLFKQKRFGLLSVYSRSRRRKIHG